jgi:hypothetical protein
MLFAAISRRPDAKITRIEAIPVAIPYTIPRRNKHTEVRVEELTRQGKVLD